MWGVEKCAWIIVELKKKLNTDVWKFFQFTKRGHNNNNNNKLWRKKNACKKKKDFPFLFLYHSRASHSHSFCCCCSLFFRGLEAFLVCHYLRISRRFGLCVITQRIHFFSCVSILTDWKSLKKEVNGEWNKKISFSRYFSWERKESKKKIIKTYKEKWFVTVWREMIEWRIDEIKRN